MPLSNDNLELWNRVGKTDPTHTKAVQMGQRKFTAIDAYAQIQAATAEWGPVGKGWGWEPTFVYTVPGLVVCELTLWYTTDNENRCDVHAIGATRSHMGEKPDHEAPKKALTDAITKALSYLGFNADVFLGKFDDSKYKLDLWLTRLGHELEECESPAELNSLKDRWRLLVHGWEKTDKTLVGDAIKDFEESHEFNVPAEEA